MSEIEQKRKAYVNAVANRCSISRDGDDTKCFCCQAVKAAEAYICALEIESVYQNAYERGYNDGSEGSYDEGEKVGYRNGYEQCQAGNGIKDWR